MVLKGFQVGEPIQVTIADIAILQLIDVAHPALHTEISGIDRVYLAPELRNGGETTDQVDIYSFGVMLYFLVTGGICDNTSEPV